MGDRVRIATRQSPLAMWQAEYVKAELERAHPQLRVEILAMTTRGDKILDTPLAKIGGKGLFVKELEQALLERQADIAVHSMKDVPMEFPAGLGLGAICQREDPGDALVAGRFASLRELPRGGRLGTSSLRRQCQLRALRPDLEILDLRGNVNTRLRKLDQGEYDAIVLAAAGLKRLGLARRISARLDVTECLPAGGQGAVGIELRLDDARTAELVGVLTHARTERCVVAERALNHRLQGGCQVPIAAYAVWQGDAIWLRGLVGSPDGSRLYRAEATGAPAAAEHLGRQVAEDLLSQGAGRVLAEVYGGGFDAG